MHFVRRAASRAVSASPSSFIAQSRTINTSSFAIRPKQQSALAQSISKRFYSEEKPKGDGQGTVGEAIDSAKEYASEATETVKESFGNVAAAAREYAPRGFGGGASRDQGRGFGGGNGRPERRDRTPRTVQPSSSIYVGNLLFDVRSEDLKREFAEFGQVKEVRIANDDRGMSKGFGYVYFSSVAEATAAIEAKNQTTFEGRTIVVNYQVENKNRVVATDPSKTLFIGNIPFEMSDTDLNKLFRDIKNVVDVRVAIDRRTGQPRGFAHADFLDIESASSGKEALHGKELYGRRLRVDFSASDKDKPARRGRSEQTEQDASF